MDRIKWRQDLIEDRNRLATILSAARQVGAARDEKLQALRDVIEQKCHVPLNPGNRKLLVFTAFADTAQYLYRELAGWALKEFGVHAALVTGTGHPCPTSARIFQHHHSVFSAFKRASRGPRWRWRDRPAHCHGLRKRRSESSRLRHRSELRHPLELGQDHSTVRPHRPSWLDQRVRWSRLFGHFSPIFKWKFCFSV